VLVAGDLDRAIHIMAEHPGNRINGGSSVRLGWSVHQVAGLDRSATRQIRNDRTLGRVVAEDAAPVLANLFASAFARPQPDDVIDLETSRVPALSQGQQIAANSATKIGDRALGKRVAL
jgi:hypothetical protein